MFLFLDVSGEFENAVEHFAYAIAVHPESHRVLKQMQKYLPPSMIQLIELLIPAAKQVSDPSLFRLVFVYLLMFVNLYVVCFMSCICRISLVPKIPPIPSKT